MEEVVRQPGLCLAIHGFWAANTAMNDRPDRREDTFTARPRPHGASKMNQMGSNLYADSSRAVGNKAVSETRASAPARLAHELPSSDVRQPWERWELHSTGEEN